MRLALKSLLVSGQKVVFFEKEWGSNQEPKASEEDALSTLPVWRTPPDQGLDSRHYLWFIFSYGMRRELMKMAVAVKRKSSPAATCQIGPVAT